MVRYWFTAVLSIAALAGEGTTPREKPDQYPVQTAVGAHRVAAEYLVHSFSGGGRMFHTDDYLVVEVAVYPGRPGLQVDAGQFTLRINGKKRALLAQAPGFVAASLKYPDWGWRPRLEAGAGMGNAGVILGRPRTVGRFPGDPRPDRERLPHPPQAPAPEDRSGVDAAPPLTADEAAVEGALPEGAFRGPVSGFLYFAFKGKTKSIRSLELLYTGPAGAAMLRLR
jgi:hypothetical protein